MARRCNQFRIVRTGENEYEVWQLVVMFWIFHRWGRIRTTKDYADAQRVAYEEVANLGAPCLIHYIDNRQYHED